ncbi:MAG: spermidine synthase [Alphaproteobacteria bacterium]
MSARRKQGTATLALFSGTLFLSAALMFAIQPMAGKALLPLVGGTPAGWIVAMAFFQIMLLLGYLFAHFLSRFSPVVHAFLYITALGFGGTLLPFSLPQAGETTLGALDIFWLLTKTLALPFIALSATSSTIQRLFTTTRHEAADDPYFLYSASNLGSFVGLFLYPLAFERWWGLAGQSLYWFFGYGLLAGAAVLCISQTSSKGKSPEPRAAKSGPAERRERIEWITLAFFPSALLSAVTTHISTDIFSAPMLWVLPLALYLLTFVVAFSRKQLFSLSKISAVQPVAVALALGFLLMFNTIIRMSWHSMVVHLVAFTVVALMCHMRLAEQRPVKDGRRLTEFYLMLSVGGALGGILNAFIAPALLDRLIEYPAFLLLSCLMNPSFRNPIPFAAKMALGFAMVTALMYVSYVGGEMGYIRSLRTDGLTLEMMFADGLLFFVLFLTTMNARTALYGGIVLLLLSEFVIPKDQVLVRRNFYGVIKVTDYPIAIRNHTYKARYLYHGTTTHGLQVKDPKYETTPTAYFTRSGPAGDVFNLYVPKKAAVIGLGAGTMNCFSTPKGEFTFFEIDPAVKEVASNPALFTFLSACKGKHPPRIFLGDGRLELAKLHEKFDVIALDAFSSDTIPAHLLTMDAIKVYLDHLNERGILLFNLSNRYFNLGSALARNAEEMGLKYRIKLDIPDDIPYASASLWFVMSRPSASLTPLDAVGWLTPTPPADLRPWTDDYTNLLSVFQIFRMPAPKGGGK